MQNTYISMPVVIIGGGQAGLSVSYYLCQDKIEHVVLERKTCMHTWSSQRWDSFCLVTPNWQCRLPGYPYQGNDPDGFMVKEEIIEYLQGFRDSFDAPVHEGVTVEGVSRRDDGKFVVKSSEGTYLADQVVIATGSYDIPILPEYASKLDSDIMQIDAGDYRNASQLPDGGTLILGAGQSGVQLMEDLHLLGRDVHLAVGPAPRSPREYRGKDATQWLYELGHYDMTIRNHPQGEAVKAKTNHYLTGRDGGHEIDLRKFHLEGVSLYGSITDINGDVISFDTDLKKNLDDADDSYVGIRKAIDAYIEENNIDAPEEPEFVKVWEPEEEVTSLSLKEKGITSIIWAIGFRPDYSWLNLDVFDSYGRPKFDRGVCEVDGCYFIGLGWLNTWGSGRFLGVAEDAEYLGPIIKKFKDDKEDQHLSDAS